MVRPYAPIYLDGGGDPTLEQIDAYLEAHFGARAVNGKHEDVPMRDCPGCHVKAAQSEAPVSIGSRSAHAIARLALRLSESGVRAEIQYCAVRTCRHRGAEHSITNRCLVCDCEHFSTDTPANDLAVALRHALDIEVLRV